MAARSKLSMLSRCHFDLDQASEAVDGPRYDIRQRRSLIPTVVSACYWTCSGVFLPVTYKVCMQY